MKTARTKLLARLALAAAVSVGLAACGGSSNKMDPEPTPLEMAEMALEDARKEVNKREADATATDEAKRDAYENLLEAAEDVVEELGDDGAHSRVVEVEELAEETRGKIVEIKGRISEAEADAEAAAMRTELVRDAGIAIRMLEDERSEEAIEADEKALKAAKNAIGDDTGDYKEDIRTAEGAIARAKALNSIEDAIMAAKNAAVALKDDSSVDAVTAAQGLIDTAEMMISDSDHLTEAEKTAYTEQVQESAQGTVDVAKARNEADAAEDEQRMKAEAKAEAEAEAKAAKEAAEKRADAAEALHGVIRKQQGSGGSPSADDSYGGYVGNDIQVSYRDGTQSIDTNAEGGTNNLSLDKDTEVAPLPLKGKGWTGQRFHRKAVGEDKTTYEAHVYSYIGKETPGAKFGMIGVTPGGLKKDSGYKYPLDSDGFLTYANASGIFGDGTDGVFMPKEGFMSGMVELTGVTRTAGTETFEAEDHRTIIEEPGSYHGVSGTYRCAPTTSVPCTAKPLGQGKGFELSSNNTWMFKPTDRTARVTNMPDDMYASFGWWMHVKADDTPAAVSAFHSTRGDLPELNNTKFNALIGTAKYEGAAVGQYALKSARGDLSLNESGHFTATATLNVNFGDDSDAGDISGTINGFKVGADGNDRDWSVELQKADFDSARVGNASGAMTVWTIGEDAADKGGNWSGQLRNDTDGGDGGVPEIVTGTFYSVYGSDGKMVGAFGATQ